MASQDDFSDLGAVPVDDFSDLGAVPIDNRNSQQNSPPSNASQQSSLLSDVAHIPYDLAVGAGGGIQNIAHGILPALVPKFEPQGISQNIGEPIGNIAGYMLGPEAALLRGARGVQSLAGLGEKGLSALQNRLGSASLYGAINEPEDRLKGAGTGFVTGGIGEGLGALLGKGLPAAAEFLHPQKYANSLAGDITKGYQKSKEASTSLYSPVFENVGNKKITNSPYASQYASLNKDILKGYSPSIKEVHKQFIENPTFNNAHKLQSDIGKRISNLKSGNSKDSLTLDNIERLEKAQTSLKNDMSSYLNHSNPNLSNQYQRASDFYKNQVIPYNQNNTIRDIVKGRETISPEELKSSLKNLSEMKRGNNNKEYVLPENHYLREALTNLSHKINRGEAVGTGSSILAGTALGNILHPGLTGAALGGALGAGAGALGRKYLAPKVLDLATNPYVHETLPKLKIPYDMLVKSLIGAQTGNG